jgi:K+-transporting ATPase A subunit
MNSQKEQAGIILKLKMYNYKITRFLFPNSIILVLPLLFSGYPEVFSAIHTAKPMREHPPKISLTPYLVNL